MSWEPAHNDDDALVGAANALSLLSPPTNNSSRQHTNQNYMKCYYDCTHCCFLELLNDPIPDDAVIYTSYIPLQYNKIEGRYTEFTGNPVGSVFIAIKRYHEFLISRVEINLICPVIQLILGCKILTKIVVILYK